MASIFQSDLVFFLPYSYFFFFCLLGLATFSSFTAYPVSSGHLAKQFSYFSLVGVLISTILLNVSFSYSTSNVLFGFFSSPFLLIYANIILFGLTLVLVTFASYSQWSNLSNFEVPFFFSMATLASLLIVISGDLLTIYLSLELQALALYVIASSRTNSTYSVESGLKYFVMGSFASCILLLGFSILYGLTGTLSLSELTVTVTYADKYYLNASVFASVLVVSGLLFKVGSAPFHFWVPDVYAGAPLVVTTFFALVPKISAWVIIVKILVSLISPFSFYFSNFFSFVSILSLIIAAYGAVSQNSLRRLIAYSAVGQTGYLILSIGTYSSEGLVSNLFYLIVYVLTLSPIFVLISVLQPRYSDGIQIDSLKSLPFVYSYNPLSAVLFVVAFLSLAGIPPLAGFFSKLYVFYSIVMTNNIMLAILALLLSVVGAAYYLKVVRTTFSFKRKESHFFFYDFSRPSAYVFISTSLLSLFIPFWGADLSYIVHNSLLFGVL